MIHSGGLESSLLKMDILPIVNKRRYMSFAAIRP